MLAAHSSDCHEVHAKVTPHSLRPTDIHASYECLVGGTVTPILYGQPWLEKPALYYWRAMGFFKEFGVSDWSARLPSSSGAGFLILLAFLHLRRFRPGGHLDAALITVSCIAIFGFARGASTDMQLAAPFCIGMLGWYAWYETGKKFWLFDLYFFGAAATLAKGPVAPFLALGIILLFVGLRREWSVLRRTIWVPGVLLYLAMVLPWYIAVQRRNPTFFQTFFVEHNLERLTTNRFQHHQPIYYYLVVLILGLMPWTAIALRALVDGIDVSIAEWKVRHKPQRYLGHTRAGDGFPEFLVLWAVFPIVFFSFSGSKLPGYILPSIAPITILTGDYIHRVRRTGIPNWLLISHAAMSGILTFVLLLCPQYMIYPKIVPPPKSNHHGRPCLASPRRSPHLLHRQKIRCHPPARDHSRPARFAALLPARNERPPPRPQLLRPPSRRARSSKPRPAVHIVAEHDVRRDLVYGLAFYRNEEIVHYARTASPTAAHVLVIPTKEVSQLDQLLQGRVYEPLLLYPSQGLSVYKVYARN